MEEGQKNKFLSKSSIENSEFMTNIVEKKPNIFKRIAAKFSSGIKKVNQEKPQKSKATTPETIPTDPNSPAVPDIAPGAIATKSPEPKEPEEKPKNVDPIILINDRPNPFITLKDKYNNLDPRAKKVILIAAGTILALLLIILIAFVLVPRTANPNDPNNPNNKPVDTTTAVDYSSYNEEDLYNLTNTYQDLTDEERSKHTYDNLGEALKKSYEANLEYGSRTTHDSVCATIAYARYLLANGNIDEGLSLLESGLGTGNYSVEFEYLLAFYIFYYNQDDVPGQIKYLEKIIALPEDKVYPMDMATFPDLLVSYKARLAELKKGTK